MAHPSSQSGARIPCTPVPFRRVRIRKPLCFQKCDRKFIRPFWASGLDAMADSQRLRERSFFRPCGSASIDCRPSDRPQTAERHHRIATKVKAKNPIPKLASPQSVRGRMSVAVIGEAFSGCGYRPAAENFILLSVAARSHCDFDVDQRCDRDLLLQTKALC